MAGPVETTGPVVTPPSVASESEVPAVTFDSTVSSPTTGAEPATGDVTGFGIGQVELDGETLLVAVADRSELRRRGLMEVSDLGELDGMLFVMDETVNSAFTMRNTLIPLHIAFFAESGELVDVLEMTPCAEEPCPTYRPDGRYHYALEVPLGAFDELDDAARISVEDLGQGVG
ncbi:MAG: DUF192 domain-containing protein [Acidimicrobiia bacterium]